MHTVSQLHRRALTHFEQFLVNRRLAPSRCIPYPVHWVKRFLDW